MDGSTALVPAPVEEVGYPPKTFAFRDIWRALLRHRRLVGAIFLGVTLIGLGIAVLRKPTYEAIAELMLASSAPTGVSTDPRNTPTQPDNGYIESQVRILQSPDLVGRLVDRLHLTSDSEWGAVFDEPDHRAHVIDAVTQAINPRRQPGTYIVDVRVTSEDPVKAARMANALVDLYFQSRAESRAQAAQRTAAWMSGRLQQLAQQVQQRESEVEAFRSAHGLLTAQGVTLTEAQVRDAEASMVQARMDQAERVARANQVRRTISAGGSADTMAGALTSDVMAQLRGREADVNRRLAEYSERYGDLHPLVQSARAEHDDIERQIAAEVSRISQNLHEEASISGARLGTLQAQLAAMRAQLAGNNAETVALNQLERAATASRTLYESLLQRYQDVTAGSAGAGEDGQVVTSASPAVSPSSRPLIMTTLLFAALGLAGGIIAALLFDRFSTTLDTADDVAEKVNQPLLTSIPELRHSDLRQLDIDEQHPAGFLAAKPLSAFAEALRLLRARIAYSGRQTKVVAITSALPKEGKSSTALCLARVAALGGQKTMLIDCDLRRRSLNNLLNIEPKNGILQILRGETTWRAAAGEDELSGAHVIPAAGDGFTAEDVFGSVAMRQLLEELRSAYDLIILDCAPVLTLADVRALATLADGAVVVARRGKTPVVALRHAINELEAINASVIGIAFNGVDLRVPGRYSYADPLYFTHAQRGMYTT